MAVTALKNTTLDALGTKGVPNQGLASLSPIKLLMCPHFYNKCDVPKVAHRLPYKPVLLVLLGKGGVANFELKTATDKSCVLCVYVLGWNVGQCYIVQR